MRTQFEGACREAATVTPRPAGGGRADPLTPIPKPPFCLRLGQGREKQIPSRQTPSLRSQNRPFASVLAKGAKSKFLADRHRIVDGVGKALRQQPTKISEFLWMNAREKRERIDVGIQGVQEILTHASRLGLVECKSVHEVSLCVVEDLDSHETRPRISFLASSQSVKPTSPDSASRTRSSRTRPCHSGGV